MKCPYCSNDVKLFGKGWQSQRTSKEKLCPQCKEPVAITFNGKRFGLLLLPAIAFGVLTHPFLGDLSLYAAVAATLFPSAQLNKVK